MPISYARNVNKVSFSLHYRLNYKDIVTASEASATYLAIFEQGDSADIFSLITGGQR